MNILLAGDLEPTEFESYRNIMKVFVVGGHNVMIWFRQQKSMFDAWDEFKPDVYIGRHYEEKEASLCAQYKTKHIRSIPLLAADVFMYGKPYEANDLDKVYFETDFVSIINHNRDEIINLKEFLNKGNKYKLFSTFRYTQTEFCGNLQLELYQNALASAKTVVATNFLNMYNFTLTNPNTIYPVYSMTETISRDKILDEHTCFTCAKNLIEENQLQDIANLDIDAMYEKFRNENKL